MTEVNGSSFGEPEPREDDPREEEHHKEERRFLEGDEQTAAIREDLGRYGPVPPRGRIAEERQQQGGADQSEPDVNDKGKDTGGSENPNDTPAS